MTNGIVKGVPRAVYLLLITYYLLLITYYLLPITYYLLPITQYQFVNSLVSLSIKR
jgi:hypothetical protein